MFALLPLLIVAPPIAVQLEEAQGLTREARVDLVNAFADALAVQAGRKAIVEWDACGEGARCSSELRARTGAKDLVFVRAFLAAGRVRFISERLAADDLVKGRVQLDVSQASIGEAKTLAGIASLLFPEEVVAAEPVSAARLVVEDGVSGPRPALVVGYLTLGLGVVSLALGTIFRLTGNAAVTDVETMSMTPEDVDRTKSRATRHLTASNVLFGGAAAFLSAGLVSFTLGE